MDKPTKPTDLMPRSFGGVKNNFSPSLQSSGYEDGVPAIYGGDNLNYQLDATGKELDYCEKIIDFINAMPIGKTITVDSNNKLVYVDKQELPSQTGNAGKYLTTDGTAPSWTDLTGANRDLSNLTSTGDARLHALKGYLDAGELLTDAEGLADVKEYAHSTFDASKFTKVGSPIITDDGIASGFSGSNYLTKNLDFSGASDWEIQFKFTTGSDITTTQRIIDRENNTGVNIILIQIQNSKCVLALNVDNTEVINFNNSSFNVTTNTTYIIKVGYTGTSYYCKYNTGGNDITIVTVVSDKKWSASRLHYIGTGTVSSTQYFKGSIDLKQFAITVDGVPVFSGNKTGTDTYTINGSTVTVPYTLSKTGSKIVDSTYRTQVASVYDYQGYSPYYTLSDTDFTLPQGEIYGLMNQKCNEAPQTKAYGINVVGSLTNNSGIISGFSSSNYATTTSDFYPVNNTWEINFKITTGNDVSTLQHINSTLDLDVGSNEIIIDSTKFRLILSSNGTSTDIADSTGTYTVLANTTYWLKLKFTGSAYILSYSTNGTSYTTDITVSSSTKIKGYRRSVIGVDQTSGNILRPFLGSVDLNNSNFIINDQIIWQYNYPVNNAYPSDNRPTVIIDSYVNGSSWYRIYSDGWCEQGGLVYGYSVNQEITINFLVNFINSNYTIQAIQTRNAISSECYPYISTNSMSTTQFKLRVDSGTENLWQASGYIK